MARAKANGNQSTWEVNNKLLTRILNRFKEVKPGKRQSKASREWFRQYTRKNFSNIRLARLSEGAKIANKPTYGKMYMFAYPDPKHKDTLEIYDAFPLVFFFNLGYNKHGLWYGINLHYLAPKLRLRVFEILLKIKTDGRINQRTRIRMTWDKLKALAEHDAIAHCVHAYYPNRIASKLIEVDPRVWEIIISLPTERFVKGTNKQAWRIKK